MRSTRVWLTGLLLLAAVGAHAAVEFLHDGAPCAFPFEEQGATHWECVPFANGGRWCPGLNGVWGPCKSFEQVAAPAGRKVVEPADVIEGSIPQPCCTRLAAIGFESNLPVIIIETDGKEIPDEPKTDAVMCTCGSEGAEYSGPVGIEIRGSTSARDYEKKSFAVETRTTEGDSQDVNLLGLPEDNDWVMYGPEADATLGLRNVLAYTLSRAMGRYASRLKYFEMFLVDDGKPLNKNHYNGLYLLAENVKRGKDRVDISKAKEDDLSGGYIFKYDNDNNDPGDNLFATRLSTLQMILVYPKGDDATPEHISAIEGYVNEFEGALISKTFANPATGYKQYIDMGSFVDYFIVSEITKNPDSYRGSAFIHKDRGGLISMGPVWDYNEAFGVCCGFPLEGFKQGGRSTGRSGGSAISPEGWRFLICIDQHRCKVDPLDGLSLWYRKMWQDPAFPKAVKKRWTELRALAFSDEAITEFISETRDKMKDGALRNYRRWRGPLDASFSNSANLRLWSSHVDQLEDWLFKHLAWMDLQLISEPIEIPTPPVLTEVTDTIAG